MPCVSSRTHPKRSTIVEKKAILRGRAQNMCVHHPWKKWRRSPKKINWFPTHLKLNELVCVFQANTLMRHSNVTQCAWFKDITLTTQCFIFVLFIFCLYYNKYFVISLQIKSWLVLIISLKTSQSQLSVLFLFYYLCLYYNKYFVISLQIKSSLVLIINYSKDLALK